MTDTDTRAGLDLAAIEERLARANLKAQVGGWQSHAVYQLVKDDVPALLAEIRRLRTVADAARRWRAGRDRSLAMSRAYDLMVALDELDAPAPPSVAGEAAQRPVEPT